MDSDEKISAVRVINGQLAAYNARDLERFVEFFSPEIVVRDLETNQVVMRGLADVRRFYGALFSSPQLQARIVHRTVFDSMVVDHQLVTGRQDGDVELMITYEVVDGQILRAWFIREVQCSPVSVRAGAAGDVPTLCELGRETYRQHFASAWSPEGLTRYVEREFERSLVERELAAGDTAYLVAELDDYAVGYAKLRYPRPLAVSESEPCALLQRLYLRAELVSRGIGRRLLAQCEANAQALGLRQLWLEVFERNTQATTFYVRQGYTFVRKERFATDLRDEPTLIMAKRLA